ncbi:MAG TPA: protein-disulfide reductase DsbD domain-containing protein [Caulobacteraceae bacterium]|nr:protein-disulfide reductase DsbD domain-containing protein [Caulobacteraceae bacterium]
MKGILRAATLALVAFALAGAARAQFVRTPHLNAALVADERAAAPGSTVWVAAVQRIDKGWHTYWRNPGDAGAATTLAWTLPQGWSAGDIVWPAPSRFPLGPIMNYGYAGEVVLAVPVHIPAQAKIGTAAPIRARMEFLVCADVCVPGSADLALTLPIAAANIPEPTWGPKIHQALAEAPARAPLAADFQVRNGRLQLAVAGPLLEGRPVRDAYFFPYDDQLIAQSDPEQLDLGPRGLTIFAGAGPELRKASLPARAAGVLAVDGAAYQIAAPPGPPPPGSSGLGPPRPQASGVLALATAAGLAFLGGVILNLMPCVFPVLAMKAAALARLPERASAGRLQGLAFAAGVVASFLALAAALIGARAAGAAVGWGFQLQSPLIVAVLALIMLAAAFDLSGVFEIGASLQRLGGAGPTDGVAGAALTGALAVVVAAPCTAPLMGPALGWAITQPAVDSLAVFAALGLGFAAPLSLLAFSPALVRRLPRPGAWMVAFRQALAFPMYAAAAWLAWVLARQAGAGALARLLAAAIILAIAATLFGAMQRRQASGKRAAPLAATAGGAAVLALALTGTIGLGATTAAPAAGRAAATAGLAAQAWSPALVETLRAQGRPVFVNFTAAWCVTCQVNERLALATPAVARAFRQANAAYLVADWTRRDPAIARALANQGRIGVPLYLVYDAAGDAPKVLPQLLTPTMVARAVAAAGSPARTG